MTAGILVVQPDDKLLAPGESSYVFEEVLRRLLECDAWQQIARAGPSVALSVPPAMFHVSISGILGTLLSRIRGTVGFWKAIFGRAIGGPTSPVCPRRLSVRGRNPRTGPD